MAAAPPPPPAPFALLEEDEEETTLDESPSLGVHDDAIFVAMQRSKALSMPSVPRPLRTEQPTRLGGRLAHRVMRDALALQLARRGFDGLRQSALWLVTELTADFLKALGTQLANEQMVPPVVPAADIVRRIQRHANMHGQQEWRQAQLNFMRMAEPAAPNITQRGAAQPTVPASVAPLYTAMRAAWNYKNSSSGRQAHAAAGQTEVPSSSSAPIPAGVSGRELAESLRLSKKQRQMAETWLQASTGSTHTAPVLLPGRPAPPETAAPTAGGGGGGGRGRRGR